MKNKFKDLNDHLFAQLERLSDEGLSEKALNTEIKRAHAMVGISNNIVSAAALQLKAVALKALHGDRVKSPAALIDHSQETPRK